MLCRLSRKGDLGECRIIELVDTVASSTGLVGVTGAGQRALTGWKVLPTVKLVATRTLISAIKTGQGKVELAASVDTVVHGQWLLRLPRVAAECERSGPPGVTSLITGRLVTRRGLGGRVGQVED
jgi:hypothetical protein